MGNKLRLRKSLATAVIGTFLGLVAAGTAIPQDAAASGDARLASLQIPDAISRLLDAAIKSSTIVARARLGVESAELENSLATTAKGPTLRMTTDNPALSATYKLGDTSGGSPFSLDVLPAVTADFSGWSGTSVSASVPLSWTPGSALSASVSGTVSQSLNYFIGRTQRRRLDEVTNRARLLSANVSLGDRRTTARTAVLNDLKNLEMLRRTVLELQQDLTTRTRDIEQLGRLGSSESVDLKKATMQRDLAARKLAARKEELAEDRSAFESDYGVSGDVLAAVEADLPTASLAIPAVPAPSSLAPDSVKSAELNAESVQLKNRLNALDRIPSVSVRLNGSYSGTDVPLTVSVYVSFSFDTPEVTALRSRLDANDLDAAELDVAVEKEAVKQDLVSRRHRAVDLSLARDDVDTAAKIAELEYEDTKSRHDSGIASQADLDDAQYQLTRARLGQQLQYIDELIFAIGIVSL